jgi:hypothetical protein
MESQIPANETQSRAVVDDVVDRETLVSIFADVLGRLVGDDWRLRDRVVAHMGVLAAARPPGDARIVAVDCSDLGDLAESVAWAIQRSWSL